MFLFYQGVLFSSSLWVYFWRNTAWSRHRDTGNSSYCDISHLCKSFLDKHTNEIYELSMASFQAVQDSLIGDLVTQQAGTTCGAFSQRIRPRIIFSISYFKNCLILSQNVKYGTFVRMSQKTYHVRYEKIILGRIRCEKAP